MLIVLSRLPGVAKTTIVLFFGNSRAHVAVGAREGEE